VPLAAPWLLLLLLLLVLLLLLLVPFPQGLEPAGGGQFDDVVQPPLTLPPSVEISRERKRCGGEGAGSGVAGGGSSAM
jgi:hypothetical protein